jgi:hypothetical protein
MVRLNQPSRPTYRGPWKLSLQWGEYRGEQWIGESTLTAETANALAAQLGTPRAEAFKIWARGKLEELLSNMDELTG